MTDEHDVEPSAVRAGGPNPWEMGRGARQGFAASCLEETYSAVLPSPAAVKVLQSARMRPEGLTWKRLVERVVPLSVALCTIACKSEQPSRNSAGTAASSHPAASGAPVSAEALQPPQLSPPADARPISGGGHWKILRAGSGPGPRPDQQLSAEVSVWASDGKLVESSRTIEGPANFQMSMLPETLHPVLQQLGPGSEAILWLPEKQVAGFKPPSWPTDRVIVEIEVLAVKDDPKPVVERFEAAGHLPKRGSERAVDIGSPPSTAKKTSTGLRYVVRREGTGPRPTNSETPLLTYVNAYALRLQAEPILEHQKMTLKPVDAPGGLGEALMTLRTGGLLQVWVPADKAGTVLPGRDGTELVLDVYLHSIE